jgi:heterodisulfide reductase subunit A
MGRKCANWLRCTASIRSLIEAVDKDERQSWNHPATVTKIMTGIARLKHASINQAEGMAVSNRALVVGGGAAGMSAALAVAEHGVNVTLVEASDKLGGNMAWLHETIDGTPITPFLQETAGKVEKHPGIDVMTNSRVVGAFGQAGHFISTIETAENPSATVEHGAVILATGGVEAPTDAYGYGTSDAVVTQKELELRIHENKVNTDAMDTVVMIQCVGSREEPRNYCSRVCCPTSLKQALWLKKQSPTFRFSSSTGIS